MREIKYRAEPDLELTCRMYNRKPRDFDYERYLRDGKYLVGYIAPVRRSRLAIYFSVGILAHPGAVWGQAMMLVKPETIGEYTGCRDKNGKEIYEGDRVRHEGTGEKGRVEYKGGAFVVILEGEEYKEKLLCEYDVFRQGRLGVEIIKEAEE